MPQEIKEKLEEYIQKKIDELNRNEISLETFIMELKSHFDAGDFGNYDYEKM